MMKNLHFFSFQFCEGGHFIEKNAVKCYTLIFLGKRKQTLRFLIMYGYTKDNTWLFLRLATQSQQVPRSRGQN